MKYILKLAVSSALATFVGCTTGATGAPNITMVNPLANSKLQFAVGTANLYGMATVLNVVSTLRQPSGESALGVDTPTISGNFSNSITAVQAAGSTLGSGFADVYTTALNFGPSLPETSASPFVISGTSQTVHPGTPFCDSTGPPPAGFVQCPAGIAPDDTTFGQSGGVFAMGIAPYNIVANTAQSYSYQPYAQPMYDAGSTTPPESPQFVPWGGPPAFDPDGNKMGTRDGLVILGTDSFSLPYFLGVGEGITVFNGITPGVGQYRLSVQVGIIGNNGSKQISTISANAQLSSLAPLPTLAAPLVTPDASGDGGATFSAVVPAGVTEELIQIVDYGPGGGPNNGGASAANCQGPKGPKFAPVYYTVAVKSSGGYVLEPNHGPNNEANGIGSLTPTPSICTSSDNNTVVGVAQGDNFTVQVFGFDYPDYEAVLSLTQSFTQTPQITGANGQADITISPMVEEDWGAGGYTSTTLTNFHHPMFMHHQRHFGIAPLEPPGLYRKLGIPRQL